MLSPKQLGSSHGRLVILSAWNWLVSTINLLVDHLYIWTSMLNCMMIFITIGRRVAHFTLRLYCNIIWTIQTEPRGELVLNILFRGRPKHLLRSRAPKAMSNCRSMRWSFAYFRRRSFFGVGLDGLRGIFFSQCWSPKTSYPFWVLYLFVYQALLPEKTCDGWYT